jgi:hypothetical protein
LDAGKAIVQGCTFNRSKLDVTAGSNIISAILTGNQAEGGFRVDNHAGNRAQIALNEQDPIDWTKAARAYYQITLGQPGDGRYLEGWHNPERAGRPMRWSRASSRLRLPVIPGKRYAISLELEVPPQAVSPDAGLYLDGKQLAPLKVASTLTAAVPPSETETVELELRCKGWVPQAMLAGSSDARTLGVRVFKVTMRTGKAEAKIFDANSGQSLAASGGTP